jgi:transcriptional regulator with XRE-family HTH domain
MREPSVRTSERHAQAREAELERLIEEQRRDDTHYIRPQRMGSGKYHERDVLSLDGIEHAALEAKDIDSGADRNYGAKFGVPRGAVPVDITGRRISLTGNADRAQEQSVASIHRRLVLSGEARWEEILYEAAEELVLAFSPRLRPSEQQHVGREERVSRWVKKYLTHPELTREGRVWIVTTLATGYVDAAPLARRNTAWRRHLNGETQQELAAEYGVTQGTISKWCRSEEARRSELIAEVEAEEERKGETMTPRMEEALVRLVREAARNGARTGVEDALAQQDAEALVREAERILEEEAGRSRSTGRD